MFTNYISLLLLVLMANGLISAALPINPYNYENYLPPPIYNPTYYPIQQDQQDNGELNVNQMAIRDFEPKDLPRLTTYVVNHNNNSYVYYNNNTYNFYYGTDQGVAPQIPQPYPPYRPLSQGVLKAGAG